MSADYMDKIVLGDCINGMRSLPAGIFDFLLTDPPYGINFNGKEGYYGCRYPEEIIDGYVDVPSADYRMFSEAWITQAIRVLKPTGSGFIVSGWTNLEHVLHGLRVNHVELTNHVVWEYTFGVFASKHYVSSHYHILYFRKDPKNYTFNPYTTYEGDVWKYNRNIKTGQGERNANALPMELVSRMVAEGSNEGDLVLDPFMGCGTTAKACVGLKRHYFGYEINEKAYKIATEMEGRLAKAKGLFT
jgi:site-specific DNA-methyltransferase (adenine-specific)